jgi:NADPH-dependent 7-cyano-7-deazaguanine reductase QueF
MSRLKLERKARDKAYAQIIGLFSDMTDLEMCCLAGQEPDWYEDRVKQILEELVKEINEKF